MSASYELEGVVKLIGETRTFASGFTKRELVVTVEDGQYPQDINIEFHQDNVAKLDEISEGDLVEVSFNIRGREYNGRYFNNLVGWKIKAEQASNDDFERPEIGELPPVGEQEDDSNFIPF